MCSNASITEILEINDKNLVILGDLFIQKWLIFFLIRCIITRMCAMYVKGKENIWKYQNSVNYK